MVERFKSIAGALRSWFVVSVWIVGAPSVFWYSGLGIAKTIFSAQCGLVGRNCDAGWSAPPKVKVEIPGFDSEDYRYPEDPPARKR